MSTTSKKSFNDKNQKSSGLKKRLRELQTNNFKLKNILVALAVIFGISSVLFALFKPNLNDGGIIGFLRGNSESLKFATIVITNFNNYSISYRSHFRVFNKLKLNLVDPKSDWDVLWTREYPFEFDHELFHFLKGKKLLQHQKVNHFPDISGIVAKDYMNDLNRHEKFILPSFTLPQQQKLFDEFIKKNPNKKLLEKNIFNRGVKIVKVEEIDKEKKEVFYQEFMDNPFLIDGHAFDFGVYVLITSFDPIRVYRYSDEILLRFCPEKYHPFDPRNRDKYVVADGTLHATQMPSFKELYWNFKFSSKTMFENLIKSKGFDVKKLWNKIDYAIATIVRRGERNVIEYAKELNHSMSNSFELVRFDIILDAELNPFVVEVNMSPNLTPAQQSHEENSLIYEQLIYNVVKMIGAGSKHEFMSRFDSSDTIVKNQKNLATSITECVQNDCQNNCNKTICEICQPCMKPQTFYQLSEAFREHQNAANFKRVFPNKNHFNDDKFVRRMNKNNQIMMKWFKGKCEEDERWC